MTKKINEQQPEVSKNQKKNKEIYSHLLGWESNSGMHGIYDQRLIKCKAERKLSKEMNDDK